MNNFVKLRPYQIQLLLKGNPQVISVTDLPTDTPRPLPETDRKEATYSNGVIKRTTCNSEEIYGHVDGLEALGKMLQYSPYDGSRGNFCIQISEDLVPQLLEGATLEFVDEGDPLFPLHTSDDCRYLQTFSNGVFSLLVAPNDSVDFDMYYGHEYGVEWLLQMIREPNVSYEEPDEEKWARKQRVSERMKANSSESDNEGRASADVDDMLSQFRARRTGTQEELGTES